MEYEGEGEGRMEINPQIENPQLQNIAQLCLKNQNIAKTPSKNDFLYFVYILIRVLYDKKKNYVFADLWKF